MAASQPTDSDKRAWREQTRLVQEGVLRSPFGETCEAIYMTSGFVYGSAEEAEAAFNNTRPRFVYSRFSNPTVAMFEARMAGLEGAAAARATSSGMAAVFAALACQLKAGQRVVASNALFGSCNFVITEILPRFGIETVLVDGRDLDAWQRALAPGAAAVFVESPSNPQLQVLDLQAIADLAHRAGARVIVDNVFASPLLQKPLELGADIVVYSATKHIDGQGRCLGGVILADAAFVNDTLQPFLRHTAPALPPTTACLPPTGRLTLPRRVDRKCPTARPLARALEGRPGVTQVLYPALDSHPQRALAARQMRAGGSLVSLSLAGGKPAAFRFLNALRLIVISNNLGDSKSLVTHPATTTHQRLSPEVRAAQGIDDGMVRLSVGLEDVADIEDDLTRALAAV